MVRARSCAGASRDACSLRFFAVGREGETYLRHILSRYNATLEMDTKVVPSTDQEPQHLADFTMFLQDRECKLSAPSLITRAEPGL